MISSLAARGLVRALSSASIRVGMSRLSNEPLDFLDWRQQGKLVGVPPAKRRWRGDIGSPAPFRSDRRPEVVIEPSQQAKINESVVFQDHRLLLSTRVGKYHNSGKVSNGTRFRSVGCVTPSSTLCALPLKSARHNPMVSQRLVVLTKSWAPATR